MSATLSPIKKIRFSAWAFVLMFAGLTDGALASPHCAVPLADWQPKAALEAKLKAEGWQIHRIRTDDGCYRAKGTRADGTRIKATFAPDTLNLIRQKIDRDE